MGNILEASRANLLLGATSAVVTLVSSVVVVRTLGPSLYGEYATILAIVAWGLLAAEAGGNAGFMRFMGKAEQFGARASLYQAILLRRWLVLAVLTGVLLLFGPHWAKWAGFDVDHHWNGWVFSGAAIVITAGLTGQLAYCGLLGAFKHREALMLSQSFIILRSLALVVVAIMQPSVQWLVAALVAVAVVEAGWYHASITRHISTERAALPTGMVWMAWRHGLVTVYDKVTSAVGNGPFLLLVLAAYYTRIDLALLAIAAELVAKALSVTGMPAGNMVLPYLNSVSDIPVALSGAMAKVIKISIFIFLSGLGAIYVLLPSGLTLLYGDLYSHAVPLSLLLAAPVFIDAWGRFAIVTGLVAKGHYREVVIMNTAQAALAVTVLVFTYDKGIITVLVGEAIVRFSVVAGLLILATRAGMLSGFRFPYTFVAMVLCAVAAGLGFGEAVVWQWMGNWSALAGFAVYAAVLILGARFFKGYDKELAELAFKLAGRHRRWVSVLIPASARPQ